MKIATFNINNVNKRLPNLTGWLRAAKPDVVALQELKSADADFPAAALRRAGYEAVWRGQKTWNGVAILARGMEPVVTRTALPGDAADTQSRYIEAAVNGILIGALYAPNGNPQPGPKFDYKLAWLERLVAHAKSLRAAGVPVALIGDYNVVPTENDIYATKSYDKDALLQPESRARLRAPRQARLDRRHPHAAPGCTRSTRSGTTCGTAGRATRACASTTSCSAPIWRRASPQPASTATCAASRSASDHAPVWVELADAAPARSKARTSKPGKPAARAGRPTRKPPSRRPLLVIDGDSFAHRAYHALPKSIMRKGDRPAGAILGFANMLLRFYHAEEPRAVLVAWDTLTVKTYRHEAFPAYQSGRDFDDAIVEQLKVLPELVAACGFANAKAPGYEADDFLAAAVAREEKRGGTALVASGDRDTFQLASAATTILYPVRAGEMARIDPAEVRVRYGVEPAQVPDFIALRGDPSDKLPGAPGVGAQGAAGLLRKYGSLEKLLAAGRYPELAEQLRLFRAIATMNPKAPLSVLRDQKPTWDKAAALARKWQLNQLADRLEALRGLSAQMKTGGLLARPFPTRHRTVSSSSRLSPDP